jgi:hypothetical protein
MAPKAEKPKKPIRVSPKVVEALRLALTTPKPAAHPKPKK